MLEGAFTCVAKDLRHEPKGALPCQSCDTLVLRVTREIEEAVEEERKSCVDLLKSNERRAAVRAILDRGKK